MIHDIPAKLQWVKHIASKFFIVIFARPPNQTKLLATHPMFRMGKQTSKWKAQMKTNHCVYKQAAEMLHALERWQRQWREPHDANAAEPKGWPLWFGSLKKLVHFPSTWPKSWFLSQTCRVKNRVTEAWKPPERGVQSETRVKEFDDQTWPHVRKMVLLFTCKPQLHGDVY